MERCFEKRPLTVKLIVVKCTLFHLLCRRSTKQEKPDGEQTSQSEFYKCEDYAVVEKTTEPNICVVFWHTTSIFYF